MINSSINNLISNNNQQVKINREITLQLKEVAFKTKEAIQLFNSKTTEFNAISILENLKVLSQNLEHILETITLAKIGILNTIIVSDNEITPFMHDLAREKIIYIHRYQSERNRASNKTTEARQQNLSEDSHTPHHPQ